MQTKSTDKHGNVIHFNPKAFGQRYDVNGDKKTGVTTIIGQRFGKGALIWWAENIVYESILSKYQIEKKPVDFIQQEMDKLKAIVSEKKMEAAQIGTNFHNIAEQYILGKNPTAPMTEPLLTMYNKFTKFWDNAGFEVVATEKTMYSNELDVCGTADLIVTHKKWNGKFGILDFKTSKDYYPDMTVQLAAYAKLCEDSSNIKIDYLGIVKVPKEPTKDIDLFMIKPDNEYLDAFKHCQALLKYEASFGKKMRAYKKQLITKGKK